MEPCQHCGQSVVEVVGGILVHDIPDDPDRPDACWGVNSDFSACITPNCLEKDLT